MDFPRSYTAKGGAEKPAMNNANNHFPGPDDKLDALLKKRAVRPSADFTAKTLASLHAKTDVTDTFLDDMLAKHPVRARQDFTARTLARVARRDNILSILRPVLAAAASVAVSISGIWVYENASRTPVMKEVTVAESYTETDEIQELATALSDAAPLLDPKALETIAFTYGE